MEALTNKKTILICDDEPDVLISFEIILKSKYNLILVDCGEKCIQKYIEEMNLGNKIDVVVLDYKLYDMTGDFVARGIQAHAETKIILISALDIDDAVVKELESSGLILKYLLKPIETECLTNLIDELVKDQL